MSTTLSRESGEFGMAPMDASAELSPTAAAAEKQFEIQSAIIIARRFPRNEDQAFAALMRACLRSTFAEDASYSFPRGNVTVTGPSIGLAREFARVWGNIRYGLEVLRDDDTGRKICGWAWDLETNTKVSGEDAFQKLIQRKITRGAEKITTWVPPDERDLRELTNRRGAILIRNSILQLLPKDYVEDALGKCRDTLRSQAEKDPDAARKKIILAFSELNITPVMLEQKLGHPLNEASPAEIAELRSIYKSISDGNSTWAEYVARPREPETPAPSGLNDLTNKLKQQSAPATDASAQSTAAQPATTSTEAKSEESTQETVTSTNAMSSVADVAKSVVSEAANTSDEPPSTPKNLMPLDEIKERLSKAPYVSDVRALRTVWCSAKVDRPEVEKSAITELCEARIAEIKSSGKAAKKGGGNGEN